jgi:hypothetical protein
MTYIFLLECRCRSSLIIYWRIFNAAGCAVMEICTGIGSWMILGDMDTGYCMEQKVPGRHSGEVIARQADS